MPRPCKVCSGGHSDEIERLLAAGESFRNVSNRFEMSPAAVFRHTKHMVKDTLRIPSPPAQAAPGSGSREPPFLEIPSGSAFLDEITRLIEQARRVTERAIDKKQDYVALMGISKQRELAELLAKVSIFIEKQYSKPVAPTFHEIHYIASIEQHPQFQALRAAAIRAANGDGEKIAAVFDNLTEQPDVDPDEYTIGHEVMK